MQRLFLFCFCFSGIIALLPLVARDQLASAANVYGMLYGGIGTGAITGGLLLSRLRRGFGIEAVVTAAVAATAPAILLLAFARAPSVALAACFLAGMCWLVNQTMLNAVLQLAAPRRLVGRMAAMHLTFTYLGLALGSWVWGAVADHGGARFALMLCGAAMAGTAIVGRWRRLPDVSGPDPDAIPAPADI